MENNYEFMTFSLDESFDPYDGPTCIQRKEPIKNEINGNSATSTDKKDLPDTVEVSSPAVYKPVFDMVSTDGAPSPQSEQNIEENQISPSNNNCLQSDLEEAITIIDELVAKMKLKIHHSKELVIDPVLSIVLEEFLEWEETISHEKNVTVSEISKEIVYSPVSAVNSPVTFERIEFNTGQNDIISKALQNLDTMTATPISQNSVDLTEQQILSPPTIIPKRRGRPAKGKTAKSPRISEPPSPICGEDFNSSNADVEANSFNDEVTSTNAVTVVSNSATYQNIGSKDQSTYFSMVNYINQPEKSPASQVNNQQFNIRASYAPLNSPNQPLPASSPVGQIQQFNSGNIRPQYQYEYVPVSSPNQPLPALSPMGQVQQFNTSHSRIQYVSARSPNQSLPALSPMSQTQQFNSNNRTQNVPASSPNQPLPALSPMSQTQQFGNPFNNVVQQRVRSSMVQVQVVPNSTTSNYHQQRINPVYQSANIVQQSRSAVYTNVQRQPIVATTGQTYNHNVRVVAPGARPVRLPSVSTLNRPQYIQMVNQSHVPNAVVASKNGITQPRQFTAMASRSQSNIVLQGNASCRPASNSQVPEGPNMMLPKMSNMTQHRQFVNTPNSMHQRPNLVRNMVLPPQQITNVRMNVGNQPIHLNNFSHQQNVNYRNSHPQQIIYNQNQQIIRQAASNQPSQYVDQSQPLPSLTGGNSPFVRSPLVSPQYVQTCNPHMVQPQIYAGQTQPTQPPTTEKVTKPKRGRKRKVKEEESIQQQLENSNMQQAYPAEVVQQKNGGAIQNSGYPMYQQSSMNYYNTYPDQTQWNGVQTHTS